MILLCFWAKHFTLTDSLHLGQMGVTLSELNAGVNPVMDFLTSNPGGYKYVLSLSMLQKREISPGMMVHLAYIQSLTFMF